MLLKAKPRKIKKFHFTNKFERYLKQPIHILSKILIYGKKVIAYLAPQWQKSDDTEKKFLGSSTYFASSFPYMASSSALRAPTKIGTTFTG